MERQADFGSLAQLARSLFLFELALPARRARPDGDKEKRESSRPQLKKRQFISSKKKKILAGANAQPQGIQVAPVGRAEMSTGALSQPQGDVVSPVGTMEMSVGTDVTPGGSYMMASHHHDHAGGAGGDEHAGHDMSSMDHGSGGGSGSGGSGSGEHAGHDTGHRRRRRMLQQNEEEQQEKNNDANSGKINLSDDPLDLSNEMPTDYRNWASILSQVLVAKEGLGGIGGSKGSVGGEGGGDYGEAKALAALDGLTLATRARLVRAASGDDPAEQLFPRFFLTDPVFHASDPPSPAPSPSPSSSSEMDHSSMGHSMGEGKSMISGAHVMSSFINYAPCVLGVRLFFYVGIEVPRVARNLETEKGNSPFHLSFSRFSLLSLSMNSGARRRGHGRDDGVALRAVAAERDGRGV